MKSPKTSKRLVFKPKIDELNKEMSFEICSFVDSKRYCVLMDQTYITGRGRLQNNRGEGGKLEVLAILKRGEGLLKVSTF